MSRKQFYQIGEVAQQQLVALLHVPALVYLLHFSGKVGNTSNSRAQAQHYIGWCTDLHHRMTVHYTDPVHGASLVYAAYHTFNLEVTVARLWEGDWLVEKWLKGSRKLGFTGYKDAPALCPECNPNRWMHRATKPPVPALVGGQLPDFEIPNTMDGYEAWMMGQFRQNRPIPIRSGDNDDDLL